MLSAAELAAWACSPLAACAASPGSAALPPDSSVSAAHPEPYCGPPGSELGVHTHHPRILTQLCEVGRL